MVVLNIPFKKNFHKLPHFDSSIIYHGSGIYIYSKINKKNKNLPTNTSPAPTHTRSFIDDYKKKDNSKLIIFFQKDNCLGPLVGGQSGWGHV